LTPLRSKEEAHDYRYFPDPDLVPIAVSEQLLAKARESLPELPADRARRYQEQYELAEDTATLLAGAPQWGDYFEAVNEAIGAVEGGDGVDARQVAHWVTGDLAAALRQDERADSEDPTASKVEPVALARLIGMVQSRKVSRAGGKTVLAALVAEGGEPETIVEREGLAQIGDSDELAAIVARAIESNQAAVEQVR